MRAYVKVGNEGVAQVALPNSSAPISGAVPLRGCCSKSTNVPTGTAIPLGTELHVRKVLSDINGSSYTELASNPVAVCQAERVA